MMCCIRKYNYFYCIAMCIMHAFTLLETLAMTTLTRFLAIISLTALVAACGSDDTDPGQQMHANAGIPVDVAPVVSQRLTEWDSFTGRLEAPQTVSLRPRVSGYIEFVAFYFIMLLKTTWQSIKRCI